MLGIDAFSDGSRRLRFGAVFGLTAAIALLMSLLFAGTAAADHVKCGEPIRSDTTLDSDVGPCSGTGIIIIAADNVTLDLNGFSVMVIRTCAQQRARTPWTTRGCSSAA